MTKFQYAGSAADYPTLGFAVDGTGSILDGSLSSPAITTPPDARWSVYGGGNAETGINRYASPSGPTSPAEPADGSVLSYSDADNAYVPTDAGDLADALSESLATSFARQWKAGQTYSDDTPLVGPAGEVVTTLYDGEVSSDFYDDLDYGYLQSAAVTSVADLRGSISAASLAAALAATPFARPAIQARDFPGASGIPSTNTSLATVTAATGSSGITSSTVFQPSTAYFRPIGAVPVYGATFPNSLGWVTPTYTKTSNPPWGIEFNIDTTDGLFEVYAKGTGAAFRVLVNGQYVAAPTVLANDGGAYWTKVAITAGAGTYRIGIEATSTMVLYGIVAIASTAFAPAVRRGPRYAALGDSFWEPTVSDTSLTAGTTSLYGQPTILRYVTGVDVFAMGLGGTGLVNPGGGAKVKYRDRIADITGLPDLDGVIVCMSGNDQGYSASAVLSEAQGVVSDLRAAGLTRPGQIVFFSSWWSGAGATIPSSLLEQLDVVKAWCATQSIPFVDILTPPGVTGTATTLTSTATAGATSVIVGTSIPIGRWIKIGPAGSAVLRKITNLTGSGPYTLTFSGVTTTTYASGAPVLEVGESDLNTGTVSRFTGPDTTHPTRAGAENRAKRFAARWASVIPR